jgi:hypothetical protein
MTKIIDARNQPFEREFRRVVRETEPPRVLSDTGAPKEQ